MATETLILRPTWIPEDCALSCFPTDYGQAETYKLVSEVTADNEATYVIIKEKMATDPDNFFGFTAPEEYKELTPTAIKICGIASPYDSVDETEEMIIMYYYYSSETETSEYNTLTEDPQILATGSWTEFEVSVPDEHVLSMYRHIFRKGEASRDIGSVGFIINSVAKNGTEGIAVTQLYLKIIYEKNDTIYLKENGSWMSIPCTIYQKQNGTWVSVDSTIFENGDKYIFIKEDDQ